MTEREMLLQVLRHDLYRLLQQKREAPPYPDSELVQIPIPPGGYPMTMFAAMLEGISNHYPEAAWVCRHGFGDGPFVLHLGPPIDEDELV